MNNDNMYHISTNFKQINQYKTDIQAFFVKNKNRNDWQINNQPNKFTYKTTSKQTESKEKFMTKSTYS